MVQTDNNTDLKCERISNSLMNTIYFKSGQTVSKSFLNKRPQIISVIYPQTGRGLFKWFTNQICLQQTHGCHSLISMLPLNHIQCSLNSLEAHCQRSRLAFVSPRPFKWVWCRWDHTRSNLICMQLQDGYHLFLQTCVAQNLSQKLVIQTLNSATKNHRDLCEDHTWSEMVVGENRQINE